MKVIDSVWFTSGNGSVGIVRVEDELFGEKYYIGIGAGYDQSIDEKEISEYGNKFPTAAGDIIFGVK